MNTRGIYVIKEMPYSTQNGLITAFCKSEISNADKSHSIQTPQSKQSRNIKIAFKF